MRFMKLIVLLFFVISSYLVPSLVCAAEVPWSSQEYYAVASDGSFNYNVVTAFPPDTTLPINSFSSDYSSYETQSNITPTSMYISLYTLGPAVEVAADGRGEYTATYSLFQFEYTLSAAGTNDFTAGLSVLDLTDSTTLYSQSFSSTSDTITVSTPVGHEIRVLFNMDDITFGGANEGEATLNYAMAVVAPEPVSYVLFVAGGTLFGGRLYFRKKKLI